jgi:signal transduction histidine kinase
MGVGFAISKKFIEGTGGTLDLTSEEGKGTTVFFTL